MFRDRADAGRQLGRRLASVLGAPADGSRNGHAPLVLGLPRGGVVVAAEAARALYAPLDVFVVRKIGAPFQPELAIGAVADVAGKAEVALNHEMIRALGVDEEFLRGEIEREHAECLRRLREYRGERLPPSIAGRDVVVVDDGIATGATVRAALQVLRRQAPRTLTLAVPVAPPEALEELRELVDRVVCLAAPPNFSSVGRFYQHFDQTSDAQVIALLRETTASAP